jgi:hypothetical protein
VTHNEDPQVKDRSMTELAIPEATNSPVVPAVAPAAPVVQQSALAAWAQEADVAYKLANQLANTAFIPTTMRNNVGNITACLLAGNELGLSPIAALKSMDVIHGVPGLRAHAMRALLQREGHEIELLESSDTVCRMRGRRKGSENWQESVWTIGRAQLAGYVAKNAMYKTQPANMLIARATGEIARLIASDAIHGVPYTVEELRDSQPRVAAVQVSEPATGAEILARRGRPVPQAIEAPAEETQAQNKAAEDEAITPEVYDEAAALWDTILDAADDKHGWTADQTEREFLKGSEGVPVSEAPLATLQAFHAHLTGGAA